MGNFPLLTKPLPGETYYRSSFGDFLTTILLLFPKRVCSLGTEELSREGDKQAKGEGFDPVVLFFLFLVLSYSDIGFDDRAQEPC